MSNYANFLKLRKNHFFINVVAYFFTLLITALYSAWIFKDRIWNLTKNGVPLFGDGAATGLFLDTVRSSSWLDVITLNVSNNKLGFPGSLNYVMQPTGNTIDILFIKWASEIFNLSDSETVIHVISVLKAPISAVSLLVFLRIVGIRFLIAIPFAIIFSTNSFNLIRSEGHFFLGLTWSIGIGLSGLMWAIISIPRIAGYRNQARKNMFLVTVSGLLVGLSSFYYSILLLVLSLGILITLILWSYSDLSTDTKSRSYKKLKIILPEFKWYVAYLFSISIGLIYQIGMLLYNSRDVLTLANIGNREPSLAPIVYSGSLESLFFDLSKTFLTLVGQEGLLNFLSTRVNWEASQAGTVTGICLYSVLLITFFKMFIKHKFNLSTKLNSNYYRVVILALTLSIFLYLPSPVNFAFSVYLPQIRVWGRLTIYIAALSLCIFALLINNMRNSFIILILIPIIFFHNLEVVNFRNGRDTSQVINEFKEKQKNENLLILNEIKKVVESGCPILYLPIYPYPEFDYPKDKVGDYAPLELIRADKGNFVWSYPSIKNTESFSILQNLVSDQPDFSRASLRVQTSVALKNGFCGILIDKLMLNEVEINELTTLAEPINPKCKINENKFVGENRNRYIFLNLLGDCRQIFAINNGLSFNATRSNNEFIWRVTTPYSSSYDGEREVFAKEKDISVRFAFKNISKNQRNIAFELKLYSPEEGHKLGSQMFCATNVYIKKQFCKWVELDKDYGTYKFIIPVLTNSKGRAEILLRNLNTDNKVREWSAVVIK